MKKILLLLALLITPINNYAVAKSTDDLKMVYQFQLHNKNFQPTKEEENLLTQGSKLQSEGKYKEAINIYNQILKKNNKAAYAYEFLGQCNYKLGNNDEAINNYNKLLKIVPGDFNTYNTLGTIYEEKLEFNKAISSYKKSIELAPKYSSPYSNLGSLLRIQKQPKQAIKYLEKAIELNPTEKSSYQLLSMSYVDINQSEKAGKILDTMRIKTK